jgi:hypothetical protein
MKKRSSKIIAFVISYVVLAGLACDRKEGRRQTQFANTNAGPSLGSAPMVPQETASNQVIIDPTVMNPYPRFSRKAQTLRYPPGVDTFAYWGNGRFNILLGQLYDSESGQGPIEKHIRVFRQEGDRLFVRSTAAYRIVDLRQGTTQRITDLNLATSDEQAILRKLEDLNLVGNHLVK